MFGIKILEERKSKYNGEIKAVKSLGLGTYIQAGGLTQSGGVVEGIWKNTLRKVKKYKREIKSVLILGLGGGSAAKIIRSLWKESKITGIDIDPVMIELGKKYLGLDKNNVDIIVSDAEKFKGKYDVVIVDLYNGDKFPEKFEKKEFLMKVRKSLNEDGVAVFNRLYYKKKKQEALKFAGKLKRHFGKVEFFFPQVNVMFFCGA